MTRYTKYKKRFNTTTMEEERLDRSEKEQIERAKQQTVEDLRASSNRRSKPVCLRCRKRGHTVKYCPSGMENTCYNCGSKDHSLKQCRAPRTSGLKFASCFICKAQGHIASQCPQNPNGMYPKGGGCRFCGSKQHLARDCKPIREAEKGTFVGQSVNPKMENPDEDLVFSALKGIQEEKNEKKRTKNKAQNSSSAKIIKF